MKQQTTLVSRLAFAMLPTSLTIAAPAGLAPGHFEAGMIGKINVVKG
jgi:hypothetical protein